DGQHGQQHRGDRGDEQLGRQQAQPPGHGAPVRRQHGVTELLAEGQRPEQSCPDRRGRQGQLPRPRGQQPRLRGVPDPGQQDGRERGDDDHRHAHTQGGTGACGAAEFVAQGAEGRGSGADGERRRQLDGRRGGCGGCGGRAGGSGGGSGGGGGRGGQRGQRIGGGRRGGGGGRGGGRGGGGGRGRRAGRGRGGGGGGGGPGGGGGGGGAGEGLPRGGGGGGARPGRVRRRGWGG